MVRKPLGVGGNPVDPFVVITGQKSSDTKLQQRIIAKYSPVVLRLLDGHPPKLQCHLAARVSHDNYGVSPGILQHFAVSNCFEAVAEHEEKVRRAQYGWVLRMRTDFVLFAPLRFPSRLDKVYVPGGGMSYRSWLRCCNDHLFLCPRALCGPYATLIHNFNSSDCRPLPGYAAGGDGVLPDGTIRPQPVRMAFPWHIARAYNATNNATQGTTCGRVVEMGLVYAIARGGDEGSSEGGALSCDQNLKMMWSGWARGLVPVPLKQCAESECRRLSTKFNGGTYLNASQIYLVERAVTKREIRTGFHIAG